MKKITFFIALLICCISCAPKFYGQISERERMDNQITGKFAQQMREKGFSPCGFGGGELEGKTRLIFMAFERDMLIDINVGRHMIVEAIEDLLSLINNNQQYIEYLSDVPFTPKNLEISIHPRDPEKGSSKYVYIISANKGMIHYYSEHPDPNNFQLVTLHEETFEEAVEILKKEGALH